MEPKASAPETPPAQPAVQGSRFERRERAVLDALRTLLRDRFMQQFGVAPPERGDLSLDLKLHVRPADNWALEFDPPLGEQLLGPMEEFQAVHEVFREGRAFCFRCENSDCEHAAPPTTLSVFAGYSAQGIPEWNDFAQALITAQDDRVDRLFAKRSERLARAQLGRELKDQQLASFGRSSKTYALLGQVITGYYRLPAASGGERLGVTFQVAETRGADGRVRVVLNTLAAVPGDKALSDLLAEGWEPTLARARETAARSVEDVERRVRLAKEGSRGEDVGRALRQVPGILRRLTESLERGFRQGERRTHHAEIRRNEQRPVHKALDDAGKARPEHLFYDEKTKAFIVCGPHGRTHVFSEEARHVTSFMLQPGGAEFRLRTNRWRQLEADEARELLIRLKPGGSNQ